MNIVYVYLVRIIKGVFKVSICACSFNLVLSFPSVINFVNA
jgi:hypothetical protein